MTRNRKTYTKEWCWKCRRRQPVVKTVTMFDVTHLCLTCEAVYTYNRYAMMDEHETSEWQRPARPT